MPRGPCPGAPRLGAVPHLNDTLRTISDHARRFGGGQWSNRSVSRGSWQHEPGHRGISRGCLGVVSGHRGKPKLVSCPETAPRQPRDLPRCQNPTFPERLSTLLPSSSSMPSKSAMKFARGKWGFGVGADLGVVSGQRRRIQCVGARFRGCLALSGHNPGPRGRAPGPRIIWASRAPHALNTQRTRVG